MAKDETYIKLITSSRWLRLRRVILTERPLCQRCDMLGRLSAAVEVHHITPIEDGANDADKRRLAFSPSNLMALCHPCHVEVHTEMGRSGREMSKRRNARQLEVVKERFFKDTEADGGGFF